MDDLITPENVTKELLKSVFDDAFMETSYDDDGDLRVKEDCSCFVMIRKDRIRLLSVWGFKSSVSEQQKLEFVNRVNSEYIIVRATAGTKNILFFDYDIPLAGGIPKRTLVLTTKRFLSIPRPAVREYGGDLVD